MEHLLGYARISTIDQQPRLQVDALQGAGCYREFTETASGARTDRPVLAQVLDQLRPGDTPWSSGNSTGSAGRSGTWSTPDGRGDRRPDQVRRVVASLVGVAGDDHDQIQAGDDLNELAAISHGAEAVVAALIRHPPLVAIVPRTHRWVALRLGRGSHVVSRDHLCAVPAAAVEVQIPELGQVSGGQLQERTAKVVALGSLGQATGAWLKVSSSAPDGSGLLRLDARRSRRIQTGPVGSSGGLTG